MGYTHSFKALQPDAQLAQMAQQIVDTTAARICGADGTGEPVITDELICLNGNAYEEEDHETFYLRRGDYDFNFCKTARKPYDDAVVAILVAAIVNGSDGAENICSDGDIVDWAWGISLYEDCFGRLSDADFVKLVEHVGPPRCYNSDTQEWEDAPIPLSCRANLEDAVVWCQQQ